MRKQAPISGSETNGLATRRGLRLTTAIGLAVSSSVLAFLGMMFRYPSSDSVAPMPGMNHLGGQLAWSLLLGGLMILAALSVRKVSMGRLQWAVAGSLLLHLFLVLSIQFLHVNMGLVRDVQGEELPGPELENLKLPDYGGMEDQRETPEWQRPDHTAVQEVEREQLERMQNHPKIRQEPQRVEQKRPVEVAKLEPMERREAKVQPKKIETEIKRQKLNQPKDVPKPITAPQVQARTAQQQELNARAELRKKSTKPQKVQRDRSNPQSAKLTPKTTKLQAKRSEQNPEAAREPAVNFNGRRVAAVRAVENTVETEAVERSRSTQPRSIRERTLSTTRQTASRLPARSTNSNSAPSNPQPSAVSSVSPSRSQARDTGLSGSAPSTGGAVSMARSSSGGNLSAANSSADSVQVAAASGGNAPTVAESTGATLATRGARPTIPANQGGGQVGSPGLGSSRIGSSSIRATSTGTTVAGQGSPQLGNGPTANSRARGDSGRSLSAVGTGAEQVALPNTGSAGRSGSTGTGTVVSGPSGVGVARRSSGLPARTGGSGSGTGTSGTSGPASPAGTPGRSSGPSGNRLAGRTTGPSARLGNSGGLAPGTKSSLSGRASLSAVLPQGAIRAEQTGKLVMSGPQAQSAIVGVSGPTRAAVRRRSAGLPGTSIASSGTSLPAGGSNRPSKLSGSFTQGRTPSSRPALETSKLLAGLVKQSSPGAVTTIQARISPAFSMRKRNIRQKIAETLGGSSQSEKAVEAGLDWLARHQHADGHWSIDQFQKECKDHTCTGHGGFKADTAATGLALLTFYGAAYTHEDGKHKETVNRGVRWLVEHQKSNGDLYTGKTEFVWFYSHGMAAIALCEAYGMTKDPTLREPARKSLQFIIDSQHPEFGGWRYQPGFESDTSVSGWQMMALKSGEMAGLTVPNKAYTGVSRWLNSVESKTSPGHFAYHPSKPESLAMTAEGLLMRQYLGAKRNDKKLQAGANYLRQNLPQLTQHDVYYWYYATQVMFHMQGAYWDEWNGRLRDQLVSTQVKEGGPAGSWNPNRPAKDKWGIAGGRLYVTCLNLLMLEVYYRHLPLYLQLDK